MDFLLGHLAFGDVRADGHVLARFALFVEKRHDGGVLPEIRSVSGLVLDFTMPDLAVRDGRPQLTDELL